MRLTALAVSLCCMGFSHGDSVMEAQDIVHGQFRLNSARSGNGYRPLTWDSSLASRAQDYAIQLGCEASAPDNLERTVVYTEPSATCEGQPQRRTFESAANFWLIAKDRPNRKQKDKDYYNVIMDPEADRIGCGRSYDHNNPCVFHTVCMLSSHGDWYAVPRDQVKRRTDGLSS
ncbi:uncharacterized protein FFB14_03625 [Fusarium fujikuroi]|nr:uncharacterized protein FFB14_03625 [Fusarium fujikuroi]